MTCATFQHLLSARELLPAGAASWLRQRLTEHATVCPPCARDLRFREELPGLLRTHYIEELAAHPLRAARPIPVGYTATAPSILGWRRAAFGAMAAAGLAGVALALLSTRHAHRTTAGIIVERSPVTVMPTGPSHPAVSRQRPQPLNGPSSPGNANPRPPETVHTPMPAQTWEPAPTPPVTAEPDDRYLDGRDPALATGWTARSAASREAILKQLRLPLRAKDDFVSVPLPRLASRQPSGPEIRMAMAQYTKEAKVVDSRLFRRVSLRRLGASLEEVCADLQQQTGVSVSAGRGLRDEKVTVLLEELPARDVMRELARLYDYFWTRSGDEGAYKYTLETDLHSRLTEEEMRNQDVNSALLSLDAQMQADRQLLGLSLDQLRTRQKGAKGEEEAHLKSLITGAWGGLQIYHRLSPAERVELLAAGRLVFTQDNTNPERRLPAEWRQTLLASCRMPSFRPDGTLGSDSDDPNAVPTVVLSINRSELGQLSLYCDTYAHIPGQGGTSISRLLATGKSASTETPDNGSVNAALRSRPEFRKVVSLSPESNCPFAGDKSRTDWNELMMTYGTHYLAVGSRLPNPHLSSADVWSEVHQRTGLPIVADFYSRLYPADPFRAKNVTAFDALCRAGDNLGARWRKDGGFILARDTAFFWDKLKEVPRRLLVHWSDDRARKGGLPLEDLIEMANQPPGQLDSTRVGEMIRHCWGLEEWMIVGGGDANGTNGWRDRVRALGCLTPGQLQASLTMEGLPMRTLTPQQQETLRGTIPELRDVKDLTGVRWHVDYVPSGWFQWVPVLDQGTEGPILEALATRPIVAAPTREATLALGRQLLPSTRGDSDIRRSSGTVALMAIMPDGKRLTEGRPSALLRVPTQ